MFAILDSNHDYLHVLEELELIVPLMEPGDYVIVEDSNIDDHRACVITDPDKMFHGPYWAILQFVAMNRWALDRDEEREFRFGFTQAVAGFWNRTYVEQQFVLSKQPGDQAAKAAHWLSKV